MKNSDANILKEYIRISLLKEDYDSDYATNAGMMGSGSSYGSSSSAKRAFIDPIVDIFKVAAGKTKEVSSSLKHLAKTSLAAIASVATGGIYEADYEKLNDEYKNQIKNIQSKYGKEYAKSWDALDRSGFTTMAFFYNPSIFIAKKAIIDNPILTAKIMSAMLVASSPVGAAIGGLLGGTTAATISGASATKGLAVAGTFGAAGKKLKTGKFFDAGGLADKVSALAKKAKSEIENFKPELLADKQRVSGIVDNFFSETKSKLSNLSRANRLEDLNISADEKSKIDEELSKISDEKERKKYITSTILSIKQNIAMMQLKELKSQRDKIVKDQLSEGISNSIATGPGSLFERYNKEIIEIAKMFGITSK